LPKSGIESDTQLYLGSEYMLTRTCVIAGLYEYVFINFTSSHARRLDWTIIFNMSCGETSRGINNSKGL